jgi:uncharacterized repeat protein (TIGR03803 family)
MNYVQGIGKSLGTALVVAMFALTVAASAVPAHAQYALFASFTGGANEPNEPAGLVTQGRDGNLYGYSTYGGGTGCQKRGCGTIYKVTPNSPPTVTLVYTFQSSDNCGLGLTLGTDGNFYGSCGIGNGSGGTGYGYVFEVTPAGSFTVLYPLAGPPGDGATPSSRPVEGRDGNYYLTTIAGGSGNCTNNQPPSGCGTVIQLIPSAEQGGAWTENVLYSFALGNDLINPNGPLLLGSNGNLYGTTQGGTFDADEEDFPVCPPNCGAVYEITTSGNLTPLHIFTGSPSDGATPTKGVIQGTDGDFYGATVRGGADNLGFIFKLMSGNGGDKILPRVLPFDYSFTTTDSSYGLARGLAQGSDGNFYGDAYNCPILGVDGCDFYGGIFEITPEGTFSWLWGFTGQPDGADPDSKVSHTNGIIYGVTKLGGDDNDGMMYSVTLDVPQPQFCHPQIGAGEVGGAVEILGEGFSSSSVVEIGGAAAVINSVEPNFITATIPAEAQTGQVTVTAVLNGAPVTLPSLQTFRVLPTIVSFKPPSGPVGTAVTITGTGWAQAATSIMRVTFGSVDASFTVNSDTQLTAIVPAGAVTAPIYITTAGGTAVSLSEFTVTP